MTSPRTVALSAFVCVAAVAISLLAIAGFSGLVYALLFTLIVLPGFPIGFALFGRRHAGGWIAGAALGYATTTLTWWAVVFTGHPSRIAFCAAWFAGALASWIGARLVASPLVRLPSWTRRGTATLLLLLIVVPAVMTRPFTRLGSEDANGNRQYRAYFIADFVWHTALTAELAKESPRPVNPFLAPAPIHYYWTYFRVPATLAAHTGLDVERVLKLNAIFAALLLLSALYLATWIVVPESPAIAASAVAIVFFATSAEGLAAIVQLIRLGQPLSSLRDVNIDAAAAWAFKSLRIDNLPRTMWYTPQHGFALTLGLLSVPAAIAGGAGMSPAAILVTGIALGASLAFNPLLGSTFCAVYGFTVAMDWWKRRAPFAALLRHALAIVPVALAYVWCAVNQVGDGASGVLHFGYWGPGRNATILNLLIQFGPIVPLLAAGVWRGSRARMATPLAGIVLGLLVMHLMTLTVDLYWVGFRGGNIVLVFAPALVALGLGALWPHARRLAIAGLAIALAGIPTTAIDAFNIQDVENQDICCNDHYDFRWTVRLSPETQHALAWIREHTPLDAIVQHEPTIRGRETWSLIPTFAERRMATGVAIPLLPVPEYDRRNDIVRGIYAGRDVDAAWRSARSLGIDYLYVDARERDAYPAVEKFDRASSLFEPVFREGAAAVYHVRQEPGR